MKRRYCLQESEDPDLGEKGAILKDSHAQTRRKGGQGSEWAAPNCLAGGEKGA
jgi:hypothetical protein